MQQQQKREQENLMKLAQELKNRELDLLTRELQIVMNNAPTPVKRRGRIGTSKLKVKTLFFWKKMKNSHEIPKQFLKKAPGQISFPLDFKHKITVMHTGSVDETNLQADTPPGSPAIKPRLRAIARKYPKVKLKLRRVYFCPVFVVTELNFPFVDLSNQEFQVRSYFCMKESLFYSNFCYSQS